MTNNDIFRRLRYLLDAGDSQMIELFAQAGHHVTRAEVSDYMKREDEETFQEMPDIKLAIFLNGLINEKRGTREGDQPAPEQQLNNNIILRKLKIAFNLSSEDIQAIFKLKGKSIGPHELSAFFRNPKQSQYRPCNDQYLRYFLSGMQIKYRAGEEE
ncbi:MAG: DUF1456 family protein [Imperialibacter sp.]|uniref:DUF1456 family protein n=1 Tax=Imperialibacter sp. TaxID=2038411 RepID=UPI0032EBFF4C